jgi:CDP-diacylglycerol--serine O-phosphatidyltransferase
MPKMIFRTLIKIPDFVTLAAVACSMSSIFLASKQYFAIAAILLMVAAFFDWLDGEVATLIKRKGRFGMELDALADAVSFGTAPALFAYFLGLNDLYSIIILIIFTMASILRLARFNVIKKMYNYYIGLATTVNGVGLPLLYFFLSFSGIPWDISKWIYLGYFLLSSLLMVSSIKLPTIKILRS